jgi:excinuclease ABC subunit B
MTQSIQRFLAVSEYRRKRQIEYNTLHNITPRSVIRAMEESLSTNAHEYDSKAVSLINDAGGNFDVTETIRELESEMLEAAEKLEFEKAALLRDQINELKRGLDGGKTEKSAKSVSYGKGGKRRGRR